MKSRNHIVRCGIMGNKNYIKALIDDYCVLDTETTGLSAYYDEII